eukprot:TRINITY_DN2271_c0_g1_i1.p1 TRINITY_DN2271_c0_g1~~TRINITY_DN2271_c0_g1_i1.p1  ORF type:complete len:434 (-),score=105.17 TRINITY_DN2271_c0_g1_i1:92-1393(-)
MTTTARFSTEGLPEIELILPKPWKQCFDWDGYPYYWNEATHESVWEVEEIWQMRDQAKLEEKIASQSFANADPAAKPSIVQRQSRLRGGSSPSQASPTIATAKTKTPSFDSLPSVPISNPTFDDQKPEIIAVKAEPIRSSPVHYKTMRKVFVAPKKKEEPLVPQDIICSPKPERRSRTVPCSSEDSRLPRYSEIYGSMPQLHPQKAADGTYILPSNSPQASKHSWKIPQGGSPLVKSASSPTTSSPSAKPQQRSHSKSVDELDTKTNSKKPFSPDVHLKSQGSDPRIGLPMHVRHVGHFETDDFCWTKKTPSLDKRGYLHLKLGSTWDSRYLSIRKGFLYVYKDSSEINLILNLKLKDSKIEPDTSHAKPNVIKLTTVAKEMLILAAPTEKEMNDWRCAIKINGAIDEEFARSEPVMRIGERRNQLGALSGSK